MSTRRVDVRDRAAARLAQLRFRTTPRHERQEKGQILVLFTMAIIVIMLFASIVIDLGVLRNNRQILVNAIDGGALAGGTLMPIDGCNNPQNQAAACTSFNSGAALARYNAVHDLVRDTIQQTYPGITEDNATPPAPTTGWRLTYRCLIGVDPNANPPTPYISRDVPVVCNPRHAGPLTGLTAGQPGADHNVSASDFKGTGPTRYASCFPNLGDKCNVVYVEGLRTTNYTFGRVAGVNQGSTGAVSSAACNGPCGQPPAAPVDLVILIDRTGSMSNTQMGYARDAAKAVLGVYDPTLQRVAVGFAGLSSTMTTCAGSGGGPNVNANAMSPATLTAPTIGGTSTTHVQTAANATGGYTSLLINKPTGTNTGDLLVAGLTLSGNPGSITAPVTSGGWTFVGKVNNGANVSLWTYWKRAIAGEVNNYTWSGFPANTRATGSILRVQDVAPTGNPIVNSTTNSGGPANPVRASSVVATAQNLLVAFFGDIRTAAGANGTTFSPPGGMTERSDRATANANGTPWVSMESASVAQAAANPSGNKDATAAASGGGLWVTRMLALAPEPVETYGAAYPADLAKWIPIGFTGTDTDSPAQAWNEAYSDGNKTVYPTTHITSAINCGLAAGAQSGIGTNLTTPIAMAAQYLQNFGRPNVKWGILFETDGEPNYGGYGSQSGEYTCQSAVNAANSAKAITNALGQHIEVFTVGYLDTDPDCPDGTGGYPSTSYNGDAVVQALSHMASTNNSPSPDGGTGDCIATENTDQDHFFCGPGNADLETVFEQIATQFAGVRTHLVQLDPLPAVYNLSVHSGTRLGGTSVTITGKYFTGVTGVRFGGNNVVCPSVACPAGSISDGSITVIAPAGTLGTTVEVVVTTPAGSSPLNPGNPGDSYTYT